MEECFPLHSKSAEAVVSAFQQARSCFPFPILGLDSDNGSEFLNESLLAYCDTEQLTFTRGRDGVKNDQCFVEQKNGAVVPLARCNRPRFCTLQLDAAELAMVIKDCPNRVDVAVKLQEALHCSYTDL